MVPAMERFLGEEEHKAHATALAGDSALIPALSGGLSLESGFGRSLADCVLGIGRGTGRRLCRSEVAAACQRGVAAPHFGAFMLAAAVRLIL